MTAPIGLLAILIGPWLIALGLRAAGRATDPHNAGAIGLSLLLLCTATGHFVVTEAMVEMLPPFVPARVTLIYLTGLLEIALAVGVALPGTRRPAGIATIIVLVLFFPANVYAAFTHPGLAGDQWGMVYLPVRAPLQVVLIAWAWWFTVRQRPPS